MSFQGWERRKFAPISAVFRRDSIRNGTAFAMWLHYFVCLMEESKSGTERHQSVEGRQSRRRELERILADFVAQVAAGEAEAPGGFCLDAGGGANGALDEGLFQAGEGVAQVELIGKLGG